VKVVDQGKVPRVVGIDFLAWSVLLNRLKYVVLYPTLSVAIFIHSSKLASSGMTRFIGVTAVPATSGMSWSWSCDGVCGLSCPVICEMRCREGVAEARRELRWASWRAWRRLAFSCRSSLRGTLAVLAIHTVYRLSKGTHFIGVFCGEAAMLYLVARGMIVVVLFVVDVVVVLFIHVNNLTPAQRQHARTATRAHRHTRAPPHAPQ
jgi:hypothetical protein